MNTRRLLVRPLLVIVAAAAQIWVLLWVLGYTLSARLVLCLMASGIVLVWLTHLFDQPLSAEPWPDPAPASPQRWFGLDPDVRRLSHQVQDALDNPSGAERMRANLRDELAHRLVARHGAPTDAPFARAAELLGERAWQALQPARRPMNRTMLNDLVRRIEEL